MEPQPVFMNTIFSETKTSEKRSLNPVEINQPRHKFLSYTHTRSLTKIENQRTQIKISQCSLKVLLLQNKKCLKIRKVWNLKAFQGVFLIANFFWHLLHVRKFMIY